MPISRNRAFLVSAFKRTILWPCNTCLELAVSCCREIDRKSSDYDHFLLVHLHTHRLAQAALIIASHHTCHVALLATKQRSRWVKVILGTSRTIRCSFFCRCFSNLKAWKHVTKSISRFPSWKQTNYNQKGKWKTSFIQRRAEFNGTRRRCYRKNNDEREENGVATIEIHGGLVYRRARHVLSVSFCRSAASANPFLPPRGRGYNIFIASVCVATSRYLKWPSTERLLVCLRSLRM